jgi:formate-dependent nitrite reductase membrane component NrfD
MQTEQQPRGADTATDEPGYYGLPVLKRPHWKWEIALYFWAGGIAAGAYLIAAIADVFGDECDRATVKVGRLLALPLVLLCPLLLIKDLGRPEKFYNMLRIVKVKSPMSAGSWGLFVFGGFAGLSALLELAAGDELRGARRMVALLGAPFGMFIGGYTGVLLSATAIPIWAKNRLLWGPTFIASAYSTGISAIVALLALAPRTDPRTLERLERAHVLSLTAEAGLLAASLAKLGAAGKPLTRGKWSSLFLPGAVGLGIALPLLLNFRPGRGSPNRGTSFLRAVCVLLGGLLFRTCVVYAGKDSADDPQAYFALTRQNGRR